MAWAARAGLVVIRLNSGEASLRKLNPVHRTRGFVENNIRRAYETGQGAATGILQDYANAQPWGSTTALAEFDVDEEKVLANLIYLKEHGLIDPSLNMAIDRQYYYSGGKITAKGNDFMLGDGGLSAIFGIVTIRLHDDTVRSLIEMRVMESDLAPPDKQKLIDQLRSLPVETIKHVVLKLVDLGLEKGPQAIESIKNWLGP